MKTNKTYTFAVPCSYVYEIGAESEEQARKILCEMGGLDIDGELLLEDDAYRKADFIKLNRRSTKAEKSKMQVIAYYETKNNNYAERVAEFANEELYEVCIKVLEKDAESHNMILTESIEESEK